MAERIYRVVNTLTDDVVFTGTLAECNRMIVTDSSGFLNLAL